MTTTNSFFTRDVKVLAQFIHEGRLLTSNRNFKEWKDLIHDVRKQYYRQARYVLHMWSVYQETKGVKQWIK